ncbi:COP23 domain-containing protein [Raphidiopsis sp. BLCC-F218]
MKFSAAVLTTFLTLSAMGWHAGMVRAVPAENGDNPPTVPASDNPSNPEQTGNEAYSEDNPPTIPASNNPSNSEQTEAYSGTKFTCVSQSNGKWATVGQRPGGQPIPVIIWTQSASKYFGSQFAPQTRCQIVTSKFNTAVQESGGSLQDVLLTSGNVNGQVVICVISDRDNGCQEKNTLFTLKPENARNPDKVLSQLLEISTKGSGGGVITETRSNRRRVIVKLSDVLAARRSSSSPVKKPKFQNNRRNQTGL